MQFFLYNFCYFNKIHTADRHCRCQPSYKISSKYLNPRLNRNNFFKFNIAAVCYLGFPNTWFLNTGSTWAADFPSLYQIWCTNVYRRRHYGPKSKSKMAAVCHLGFSKIWFLRTGTPWAADFPSCYKIWCTKFCNEMENRPPSWICHIII